MSSASVARRGQCHAIDVGLIGYTEGLSLQRRLVAARKADAAPDVLLLCEHPHVFTLGRSGKIEHLRASEAQMRSLGIQFHQTDRGGDITYHGPGQLVGYPILNLNEIRRDVVWYVRQLEEAMIRATRCFGVEAFRVPGCTGVWVAATDKGTAATHQRAKLASIGVRISRWVTSHGFAYNLSADLRFFDWIVPCGIRDCQVTSLDKLSEQPVSRRDFVAAIVEAFGTAIGLDMVHSPAEQLEEWLAPVAASP